MFFPALNGFKGEMCKVKSIHYPQEYTQAKSGQEKLNIALLELEENFGDQDEFFGLDFSQKSKGKEAYIGIPRLSLNQWDKGECLE